MIKIIDFELQMDIHNTPTHDKQNATLGGKKDNELETDGKRSRPVSETSSQYEKLRKLVKKDY